MRFPHQLPRQELQLIVETIQQRLYLETNSKGEEYFDPDKPWEGADLCQSIATLLDEHGLVPDQPQTF